MVLAASTIECIGFGIYSAIFLWCGLQNIARPNPEAFGRLMRLGPLLGISLGTGIFALIASIWIAFGRFTWSDHPTWGKLTLTILFVLWVSNIIFEIWTLDPVRKASQGSAESEVAHRRARHHLLPHCILIIGLWAPWLFTLL